MDMKTITDQFDGSTCIKCSTNDPRLPVMNSIHAVKHMRNMGSTCLESRLCHLIVCHRVPQGNRAKSAGLSDKCQIPIFFRSHCDHAYLSTAGFV